MRDRGKGEGGEGGRIGVERGMRGSGRENVRSRRRQGGGGWRWGIGWRGRGGRGGGGG